MCFGLLLMANLYRLTAVIKIESADMETVIGLADTEEVKNTPDTPAFMVEEEFATYTAGILMQQESAAYHIRHTTELPWQHAETLLLPPELTSCIS